MKEIFPYLCDNTESVEDAKMLIKMVSMGIQQAFLMVQRTMKVQELSLASHLQDNDTGKKVLGLLALIDSETVDEGAKFLGDAINIIEKHERDDMSKRKLETLNIELL